jgi:hypothetical protein
MVPPAVRGSRRSVVALIAAAGAAVLGGCGQPRQDAQEKSATYTVDIVRASFPADQRLAQTAKLEVVVRNASRHAVPDLAISIDSFSAASTQIGLAVTERPVWVLDSGPGAQPSHPVEGRGNDIPGGAVTAYTNTWALGPVQAGETRTFAWSVTAVKTGVHRVSYTVAAGLNGKARAQLSNGQVPQGSFTVNISRASSQVHIDPNTGSVVPGPPPQGAATGG